MTYAFEKDSEEDRKNKESTNVKLIRSENLLYLDFYS